MLVKEKLVATKPLGLSSLCINKKSYPENNILKENHKSLKSLFLSVMVQIY